jgi:hypothetical protein
LQAGGRGFESLKLHQTAHNQFKTGDLSPVLRVC